jgi:predicted GNAT family acetyltransferase
MDAEIRHDTWEGGGQYVLVVDGADVGELDHLDEAGTRVMHHTGVRTAFEGRGLAAQLVRRALDDARADGVVVVPTCWYVAGYLDRHPADADLRAPRPDR